MQRVGRVLFVVLLAGLGVALGQWSETREIPLQRHDEIAIQSVNAERERVAQLAQEAERARLKNQADAAAVDSTVRSRYGIRASENYYTDTGRHVLVVGTVATATAARR